MQLSAIMTGAKQLSESEKAAIGTYRTYGMNISSIDLSAKRNHWTVLRYLNSEYINKCN